MNSSILRSLAMILSIVNEIRSIVKQPMPSGPRPRRSMATSDVDRATDDLNKLMEEIGK